MKDSTRRSFLTTTAGMLSCGISPNAQVKAGPSVSPLWIDSHVHVWTPDQESYPLSENFLDTEIKPQSFLPSELFAAQEGSGVNRTVLIQMSFYEYDNQFMLDAIAEHPDRFAGVAIVDHEKSDLAKKMRELDGKGVRGFRLYAFPDRVKKWDATPGIKTLWATAAETGQAVCCLTDPGALPAIRKKCEEYPETTVVVDHFARLGMRGPVDQEKLAELLALADFPQVHVKTSAFYALGKKEPPYEDLAPLFEQVRDAFGSERLMWGSDAPYQLEPPHTYEASLALVLEGLDFLKDAERIDILRGTAERLFFPDSA